MQTEAIDTDLMDLDQRNTADVLSLLLRSQQQAVTAVSQEQAALQQAVDAAAQKLSSAAGRLVLAGAGASGRLAVQDGAEMWPTYGWPHERLLLRMAGGETALLKSVEGVEDDAENAAAQVAADKINASDVVIALAASGRSKWTCRWLIDSKAAGALTIGLANNPDTPLLDSAEHAICLRSGAEVLAGSTRMAAGTAQKIALNLFSTALMIRLNRTYGNLMVDMAAVNQKLDDRRIRMLQAILPALDTQSASEALSSANGWVKLAALIASGYSSEQGRALLKKSNGSLRAALAAKS